jgi:ribosomal protein L11 methyltransferase
MTRFFGMQHTVTVSGLSAAGAEDLSRAIENFVDMPLAISTNEIDEARGIWNVIVYLDSEETARDCAAFLRSRGYGPVLASLPPVDWVRRSLEGLAPVSAGRFFLHGAHDRQRRRSGGISLEIDAGTAFGTGHHGTTAGCLLILDRLIKRGRPQRILDVGTGSGVLAIAAARALHAKTVASDIDPEAVSVACANAQINGSGSGIRILRATGLGHRAIADAAPYDLIFANILARPLLALSGGLTAILARGGTLVLSGLTLDQRREVSAAYRNRGLIPAPPLHLGNWATLAFTKAKRPER